MITSMLIYIYTHYAMYIYSIYMCPHIYPIFQAKIPMTPLQMRSLTLKGFCKCKY